MVDRKGERRVSGGLRVESGGLVRVKVDELDPGRKGTTRSERDKENVEHGDDVKKEDAQGREPGNVLERPSPVDKRMNKPTLQDLEHLASRIKVDDLSPLPDHAERPVDSFPETPALKVKNAKRFSSGSIKQERARSEDGEMMGSPESPAMMTCFERSALDPAEDLVTARSDSTVLLESQTPPPGTPVPGDPTVVASTTDRPTSIPGAPKKPPTTTTTMTTTPKQTRRSSISSFLETLRRTYTTTASSLAASAGWVAVGHGSGVPERQVVRRGKLGEGVHQSPGGKGKRKVGRGKLEVADGWGKGLECDTGGAKKSWAGWDVEEETHEMKEGEEEEEDPREYLARIANGNAMILAAEAEETQKEEESKEDGSGLGLSLGLADENESAQAGWQKFGSTEDTGGVRFFGKTVNY